MRQPDTILSPTVDDRLEGAIARAAAALSAAQRKDGHWVFELEADATIPAEYILLRHYLGEPEDLALEEKIGRYLRRIALPDGGWSLFHGGKFDLSASIKAYFALKMIGDAIDAPHMTKARELILAAGGASASNVFCRFQLALFGAGPWESLPEMPVELILAPRWFPIHLSKMSYWARTVIVPLLVLQALRPAARNPRGILVDELYLPGSQPRLTIPDRPWARHFAALDVVLKGIRPFWPAKLRQKAIDKCLAFVRERLNGEDGLGAIYPAMANSVMMFDALGFSANDPDRAIARRSVEKLLVHRDDGEVYCQPCVSPIWDTALAAHAMLEVGEPETEARAVAALDWLLPRQILDIAGDWEGRRPGLRPGGWAFQYGNAHYPDVDDTAVVVLALDRAWKSDLLPARPDEAIDRAREWVEGMQSKGGGWGAFDADNTYYYLNGIPFADHGALLDPPTVDVSARCVSMLAQLGTEPGDKVLAEGLDYLEKDQEQDGSYFGRWGVNYVYGTWSALCALNAAGLPLDAPVIRRAVDWLVAIQNSDGGWGEDCESYALDYAGYSPAPSSASQTAWAVLGLLAAGEMASPAVARGIDHLLATQGADGLWTQAQYTGGGFPRVFYLRYHGYPKYFPLWALARYRRMIRTGQARIAEGM
jgi:squalene-hopene/tetraprenyl-beta-curcumene cyclase